MNLSLKIAVSPQLTDTLKRLQETPKYFAAGLYAGAVPILDVARSNAPRDVGGLDNSAYVTKPVAGTAPKLELGFSAPWSMYIHERMDLPHPHGGSSKFLERAVDAMAPTLFDFVAKQVAGWVEQGKPVTATSSYPTSPPTVQRERHSASSRRAALRRR